MSGVIRHHNNLWLASLASEQMSRFGGYLYVVTAAATSHTAFRTRFALDEWLKRNDLEIQGELPPEGVHGAFQVSPGYYTCSHMDTAEFKRILDQTPSSQRIRHLDNGQYTQGLIGKHDSGEVVIHYLNPNCKRVVYNYQESEAILNGQKMADPFEQFLQDKQLFRASIDTRNFTFEAYGFTESHVQDRLREGLHKHAEQYDLSFEWVQEMMAGDISLLPITMGDSFRDRERLSFEEPNSVGQDFMRMRG